MMNNKRMVGGIAVALLLSVSSVVRADISSDFAKAKEAINNNIGAIEREANKVLGDFQNIYTNINNKDFEALRPYIQRGPKLANAVLSNAPKIQEALKGLVETLRTQIPEDYQVKVAPALGLIDKALGRFGDLQAVSFSLNKAQVDTVIEYLKNNASTLDSLINSGNKMGIDALAKVDWTPIFNKIVGKVEGVYKNFESENTALALKDAKTVAEWLNGEKFNNALNQIFGYVGFGVSYILALNNAQKNSLLTDEVASALVDVQRQLPGIQSNLKSYIAKFNNAVA